ncbi:MAG: hemerythrin domain-containing protein [Clostridium sp.]
MNAIELMMDEHKYIKRMLKEVRSACLDILNGKDINYDEFYLMIDFIKNYADSHHHKKEEVILFNRMVDNIGSTAEKVIKHGMLVEHDLGRLYIRSLDEALQSVREGNIDAKLDVIANAISYTHLLERHIEKEDNVIYKFALRELAEDIISDVNKDCVEFEKSNEHIKEKYLSILENIEKNS